MTRQLFAALLCLALAACGGDPPQSPGMKVEYQTVVKEVQRPCPAKKPARPAPLARPLPTDAGALASLLAAKLLEWAGKGGYGERAEAALEVCTRP
jgi:hypothetical protein